MWTVEMNSLLLKRASPFLPCKSFRAALSSIASAGSRFRRGFSSCRAFSRLVPEISKPPYLACHLRK